MTYEQTEYTKPSLELFQEMIWDRTADLEMTDEEVRDLAIWSGHKFLGYSLANLGKSWDMTKDAVRAVVRRLDRNVTDTLIENAALVTAMPQ